MARGRGRGCRAARVLLSLGHQVSDIYIYLFIFSQHSILSQLKRILKLICDQIGIISKILVDLHNLKFNF